MLTTKDLDQIAEHPLIQNLYIIGKHFGMLPFDNRLLSLTNDQLYLILKLIESEQKAQMESTKEGTIKEVYEDPDFMEENADILAQFGKAPKNTTTPPPPVTDWVDVPIGHRPHG